MNEIHLKLEAGIRCPHWWTGTNLLFTVSVAVAETNEVWQPTVEVIGTLTGDAQLVAFIRNFYRNTLLPIAKEQGAEQAFREWGLSALGGLTAPIANRILNGAERELKRFDPSTSRVECPAIKASFLHQWDSAIRFPAPKDIGA